MEMEIIDYSESISEIIHNLSVNNALLTKMNSTLEIFTFLMLSSIAIIVGILLVKD